MLAVRVLDGYVRIVASGKRVGQRSVRDVVLFLRIGKNRIVVQFGARFEVKNNAE